MKNLLLAMMIISTGYSIDAFAKLTGPKGAPCKFDLNGIHYVGTQYETDKGVSNGALNYGCRGYAAMIRPDAAGGGRNLGSATGNIKPKLNSNAVEITDSRAMPGL